MRMAEIRARQAAIEAEVQTRSAELSAEQITAFTEELAALQTEYLTLEKAEQQRSALLAQIAAGGGQPQEVRNFGASGGGDSEGDAEDDIYDTMEYRKAFMNHVVKRAAMPEKFRTAPDGLTMTDDVGSVIPTTVLNRIIEKMESSGMILSRVTRTSYRGGLDIPKQTVKPTATWVKEGAAAEAVKQTTGVVSFKWHKLSCVVMISLEVGVMVISAFENTLVRAIVEAMVKAIERAIVVGTGTSQPEGILTAGVAGSDRIIRASSLTYDVLCEAEAALPLAYESDAVWLMTKTTFMRFYAMTGTDGQPIGRVNYGIDGRPVRTLLGREVICNDYMNSLTDDLAVGEKFGALVNLRDYILNTNYQLYIRAGIDDKTHDRFKSAAMLLDGKLADNGSLVKLVKKDDAP